MLGCQATLRASQEIFALFRFVILILKSRGGRAFICIIFKKINV